MAGIESFGPSRAVHEATVRRIDTELGVFTGRVNPGMNEGFITIAPPSGGGWVDPELVHEAVLAEASKSDNLTKLQSALTEERHLAVYVSRDNHRVWVPLVDLVPPIVVTQLPLPVTHVWALSEGRAEQEYVVWRAKNGEPWRVLDRVFARLPALEGAV